MPTYEYRCPQGHEFERFQKMSDPPVAECPECGVEAERMLSAGAGLIFKGSGFYTTDYRDEGYRKAAEAEKKGGDASAEGAGGGDGGDGGDAGDGGGAGGESGSGASSGSTGGAANGGSDASTSSGDSKPAADE